MQPVSHKSLNFVLTLAVFISAMMQAIMPSHAANHQAVPHKEEKQIHVHDAHNMHKMMKHGVPCHNENNQKKSQEECFEHCLEMASKPFTLSSSRFINKLDYEKFAYALDEFHLKTKEYFSLPVATGPPKYFNTSYQSSRTSALISLNMRLRI